MMKKLILLFLFCHVACAVKHSLRYFIIGSSGVPNFPEFVAAALVDDIQAGHCDNSKKVFKPNQDWAKTVLDDNPQQLEWYTQQCFENEPNRFKARISSLKQRFNQSGGAHILQIWTGCEWDETTGEVTSLSQYGYDGEDFLALDLNTMTWVALKPQAFTSKLKWDTERGRIIYYEWFLTKLCPEWLKKYVEYGRSSLLRTELPSVSLLQKTPSSPVSCHATGFYPNRAWMFWRKDGEELHEGVDPGEILPNHDGTFQMSVDLSLSSVAPEDWRRYDCVFQLSGVEDIITRLDKAVIRTNWVNPSNMTVPIIAVVIILALLAMAAVGHVAYKKKKYKCPPASPESSTELSEKLNQETAATNRTE